MRRVILAISIMLSLWGQAQETANSNFSVIEDSICRQILEEQPESILFSTDDKIYLRPEMIFPTTQGLFLGSASSSIALAAVFADSAGCYLPRVSFGSFGAKDYWL